MPFIDTTIPAKPLFQSIFIKTKHTVIQHFFSVHPSNDDFFITQGIYPGLEQASLAIVLTNIVSNIQHTSSNVDITIS